MAGRFGVSGWWTICTITVCCSRPEARASESYAGARGRNAGGATVAGPGPERGVIFQEYGVFPWLSVQDNIAFGLKQDHKPKSARYFLLSDGDRLE